MIKRVIAHDHAIWQVRTPVPYPLSFVNSYLIAGRNGITLLDPGIHTEEAKEAWLKLFAEEEIDFSDIEKIVLTHHHPDHYGLAGWFQEQSAAPVYMSAAAHAQAVRMWGEGTTVNEELVALFRLHGMDEATAARMIPHFKSFDPLVAPHPQVTELALEETIFLGDREYELLQTDGHATGHLCFYNQQNEIIFCGDQVVERITPNVNYMPAGDANPLASFIESLHKLSTLSVSKAYPGHRQPLDNFAERCHDIVAHHHDRLEVMLGHLATPCSAFELCRLTFGDRLTTHQLRFAMTETLAHIVYLESEQRIHRRETNGSLVYVKQ